MLPGWKPVVPPAFPTVHQKPICPGREAIVWRAHLYIISGILLNPNVRADDALLFQCCLDPASAASESDLWESGRQSGHERIHISSNRTRRKFDAVGNP
jgi:hypothetical protein